MHRKAQEISWKLAQLESRKKLAKVQIIVIQDKKESETLVI